MRACVRVCGAGINGVNVTGGSNFLMENVEVTGTGQGGVILQGGDRQSLTPGNHRVVNCTIHRFARIMQKYTPGMYGRTGTVTIQCCGRSRVL